ncbi:hypothetical protein NPIL_553531 [Nephila pilipes]|uniref:Uncharacterized protein n=1 Tax=Nephila pilipes TaxID=299642 RepID=A0A8X6I4S5_NEPPI|nr:hypothetical protein NPIL_553531 [Nephila pilipes]
MGLHVCLLSFCTAVRRQEGSPEEKTALRPVFRCQSRCRQGRIRDRFRPGAAEEPTRNITRITIRIISKSIIFLRISAPRDLRGASFRRKAQTGHGQELPALFRAQMEVIFQSSMA